MKISKSLEFGSRLIYAHSAQLGFLPHIQYLRNTYQGG